MSVFRWVLSVKIIVSVKVVRIMIMVFFLCFYEVEL